MLFSPFQRLFLHHLRADESADSPDEHDRFGRNQGVALRHTDVHRLERHVLRFDRHADRVAQRDDVRISPSTRRRTFCECRNATVRTGTSHGQEIAHVSIVNLVGVRIPEDDDMLGPCRRVEGIDDRILNVTPLQRRDAT